MGSPRPSFGRAKNYDSRGRLEYGRLGVHGWAQTTVIFTLTNRLDSAQVIDALNDLSR